MPNGIMTGDGSRDNPWVVEDGWDFNALRNIPANDSESVAFVELGGNINLSMFANFIPIPPRWFNIDGKGFVISDFSVQSASGDAGLFANINVTEYIKNIILEGVIESNHTASNLTSGLLAGRINIQQTGVVVENIEAYGDLNFSLSGIHSSHGWGGVAGAVVVNPGVVDATLCGCSFKGVANLQFNSGTAGTVCSSFGGITNFHNSGVSGASISCSSCFADVTVFISGNWNNLGGGRIGSICGTIFGAGNVTNRSVFFSACIGRIIVNYANTVTNSRPMFYSGLLGRNNTVSGNTGVVTAISRCAGFLEITYDPPEAVLGAQRFYGLNGASGGSAVSVASSYAVIKYANPQNKELPAITEFHGIGQNVTATNAFFDLSVLRETWDGEVGNLTRGVNTEQLQSRTFLESQGWVF